jgi:hypothetical protein
VSRKAPLLLTLAIVAGGVALRALPHLDRLVTGPAIVAPDPRAAGAGGASRLRDRTLSRLALGLGVEAFLIGVGVYVLLRAPGFGGLLAVAGRGPRVASLALIAGFVVLDVGGSELATYPLVPWRMFAGAGTSGARVFELEGVGPGGERVPLDADSVLLLPDQRRLSTIVREQAEALERTDDGAARGVHEATLRAIAEAYQARHPFAPFRRIDVFSSAILPGSRVGARRLLWSVEVAP